MRQIEARRSTAGSLDLYASFDSIGYLFTWLVADPASAPSGSGHAHVFTPLPSYAPPSLTVDLARDIELHRYTGVVLTSGRFSASTQDRHFGLSLNCIGKDEAAAGAIPSPSESSFGEPAMYDVDAPTPFSVTLDDGSTSWTAFCESIDLNFGWDRKLREPERRTTPTGFTGGGVISTSGKVGTLYDTDSDFLLDAIRARTEVSMLVTIQGAALGGGANQEISWNFPICMVNGDPPTLRTAGRGNIDFSVDLQALYSQVDGFGPFQASLTNSTASY